MMMNDAAWLWYTHVPLLSKLILSKCAKVRSSKRTRVDSPVTVDTNTAAHCSV
jgi:hypothetical protein